MHHSILYTTKIRAMEMQAEQAHDALDEELHGSQYHNPNRSIFRRRDG